jgi:hypothetical protein
VDSNRKKSGGKIHLQINLREPLTCQDIVDRSERWLVLDAYGSTVSKCLSTAGLTQGGPILHTQQSYPTKSPSDEENQSSKMTTPEMGVSTPEMGVSTPEMGAKTPPPPPPQVVKTPKSSKVNVDQSQLEKAEEEFNR